MKRNRRKRTPEEMEESKRFIQEIFDKFNRVSPEGQQKAIQLVSDLIAGEDDEQTRNFFTKLKMIFVAAAKTEVNTDEK